MYAALVILALGNIGIWQTDQAETRDYHLYWADWEQTHGGGLKVLQRGADTILNRGPETTYLHGFEVTRFGVSTCPRTRGSMLAIPGRAVDGGYQMHVTPTSTSVGQVVTLDLPGQPVSTPSYRFESGHCVFDIVTMAGDLVTVDATSRVVSTMPMFAQAVVDDAELLRGVFVASNDDVVVVGEDSGIVAHRVADGRVERWAVDGRPVPGAAVSTADDSIWFLTQTGTLYAYRPFAAEPFKMAETGAATTTGLMGWQGEAIQGLVWGDVRGRLQTFDGTAVRTSLPWNGPISWPLLAARVLGNESQPQLLVTLDDATMLVLRETAAGWSGERWTAGGRGQAPSVLGMSATGYLRYHNPVAMSQSYVRTLADGQLNLSADGTVPTAGMQVVDGRLRRMTTALAAPAIAAPGYGKTSACGQAQPSLLITLLGLVAFAARSLRRGRSTY